MCNFECRGVHYAQVCVDTDVEGEYIAHAVIGSRVDWIQVNYHSHSFQPTASNEGPYPRSGLIVEAGGTYINNYFEDTSKAEVFVEDMIFVDASSKSTVHFWSSDFSSNDTCPSFIFKTVTVLGGLCNTFLGISTVLIKVLGCGWDSNRYDLSGI